MTNLRLGADSGLAVLERIKQRCPGVPVFVITEAPMVREAVQAIKAGAADVIAKPIDNEHLLSSVLEALRLRAQNGHDQQQGNFRPVGSRGFSQLTPREREVLQLIANGQSNKEAGRELGISPRTIEVHRARVMEKLGAKNTADLMRIVLTT
ncbi:hypothetical protein GCM10007989_29150 [Devosia pacifica]|uniref:Uncharacterized protein n=1 Tax=Devosia pacifica TaxID=1335967 RepID=A0A918SA77_9HYPH|nr:hypothetical protein GCM10007989_29150 [Devosia pacifica]